MCLAHEETRIMDSQYLAALEALNSLAATIGREALESTQAHGAKEKRLAESQAELSGESQALKRESSGFGSPRFAGLARVGAAYASFLLNGKVNDREGAQARDAAEAAARSFVASFTAQSDKSAKGGKNAGYVSTIRLGDAAPTLIAALNRRVKYWEYAADSYKADSNMTPAEKARMIAESDRFTKLAKLCPAVEGGNPDIDGKRATHSGRPSRMVNGVALPYKGATNRDSQLAEASRLYAQHGDAFLRDDVLDAFLDNGGKLEKTVTIEGEAGKALALVEFLQANGGSRSQDSAFLQMAQMVLTRITREGFKDSVAAAFDAGAVTPSVETESDAPGVAFGAPVVAAEAPAPASKGKKKGGSL
jgi:hypothetical protein